MWDCGLRTPFSRGHSLGSAPHLGAVAPGLAGWQVPAELAAAVCGTEAGTGGAAGLELKGRRAAVLCGGHTGQWGAARSHPPPPIPEHKAPVPPSPREPAGLPPGVGPGGPGGCVEDGAVGGRAGQVVQGYRGAEMEGSHTRGRARPSGPRVATRGQRHSWAGSGQMGKSWRRLRGWGGEEQLKR